MSIPQLSAADLALLRQYDTPTICNVIELFEIQPRTAGYMDGRIRFPAFSNGVICSHGYSHIVAVHAPVRVGGIAVHPGDLLHADANGVTAIPHAIGSEVAHVAAEYVAAENVILDYVKSGAKDVKKFSEARQECMRQLAE